MKKNNILGIKVNFTIILLLLLLQYIGCRSRDTEYYAIYEDGWLKLSQQRYKVWLPLNYPIFYNNLCVESPIIRGYECNNGTIIQIPNAGYLELNDRFRWDQLMPEVCWQLSNNQDTCQMYRNEIIEYLTFYRYINKNKYFFSSSIKDTSVFKIRSLMDKNRTLSITGKSDRYYVHWVFNHNYGFCFASDKNDTTMYRMIKQSYETLVWVNTTDTNDSPRVIEPIIEKISR